MPNGFPAFRYDPTTEPRYLIVTRKTPSGAPSPNTNSAQQATEAAKLSENQYPTERGMWLPLLIKIRCVANDRAEPPKKSHFKPKGTWKKLLG